MFYRSNILALVGGGSTPAFQTNKVLMWDDNQQKCIGEMSFKAPVKAVRLRKEKIVVVLEHKVYVYKFSDMKLIE